MISVETPREFETALLTEGNVDEHDIRQESRGLSQRLRTRRRDPRNIQPFSLEQRFGRPQEASIVIDDETADRHPPSVAAISSQRIAASRNSAGMSNDRAGAPPNEM